MNEILNNPTSTAVAPQINGDQKNINTKVNLPDIPPDTFEKSAEVATSAPVTQPDITNSGQINELAGANIGKKFEPPSESTIKKSIKWIKRIFAGAQAADTASDLINKTTPQPAQPIEAQQPANIDTTATAINSIAQAPATKTKSQVAEEKLAQINVPDPATLTADAHL